MGLTVAPLTFKALKAYPIAGGVIVYTCGADDEPSTQSFPEIEPTAATIVTLTLRIAAQVLSSLSVKDTSILGFVPVH